MKRKAGVWVLLGALAGWAGPAAQAGPFMSQYWSPNVGANQGARLVNGDPSLVGPYGQPVEATVPASFSQPAGSDFARAALAQSFPPELVQQAFATGMPGGGLQLTGGPMPAPGMPGIGGPGPAVSGPAPCGVLRNPPGAVAAIGALTGMGGPGGVAGFGVQRTEIRFVGPAGMRISWYAPRGDGHLGFTTQYLEAPARYNFMQASIYRLKLSDIPYRPGVELYPTLEVVPANPKTATFLAHSAVPVVFTEDDLEQVAAGNFVVKVIYLPDPQYQDLAATGPDEVVSSRLEPGVDPIIEAKRRGCILAIVRLGNIDLEAPNTPAMDAPPGGYGPGHGAYPALPPGVPLPPGAMGGMPPGMMPGGLSGAPTMPARGGPAAPTVPTPLRPGVPPAITPLNLGPSSK
jgi:hypothetical protein